MENFEKFVRAFLNDEIEPYLKSEALPSDNSGPVKVKNFFLLIYIVIIEKEKNIDKPKPVLGD